MKYVGWRFPPLSGGTRQGYTNNDIEGFQGEELIDNLAREICQNSLDAHNPSSNLPVKVVFELKQVPKQEYDVFSQYKVCIDGCRKLWGENTDEQLTLFLKDADKMLTRDTIPVLIASDYETKGLKGSRTRAIETPWEALTGEDGISVDKGETGGGAFGIGKNAPFACSALSMVFYNTYAIDGEKAFVGVARLASLFNKENKETQRVGKYQINDDDNEKWLPIYSEDSNAFRDLFLREQIGTDVIVVGFNQEHNWLDNVAKAIIKNFFVAIKESRLIVELKDGVNTKLLNAEKLHQEVMDYSEEKDMIITSQLYQAFTAWDKKEQLSILAENDAEVYIKSDSSFNRTIANFRDTGMLVGQKSRRIFQHYAAVLVIRGTELSKLLRATEPPRHNTWDYKRIKRESEKEKRKKAKNAIETIDSEVLQLLKNQFEIVTEDSVDAVGVGEYLPDDVDSMGGASEGDDILKPKIKIGKVKTVVTQQGTMIVQGYKEEGAETKGDVHNHEKNPDIPPNPPHPPRPVDPDIDTDEPKQGAAKGSGTKTVVVPNLSAQRAFPLNTSMGLYKIVIKPTENYNNIFISCSALGEDGRTDVLEMESFMFNGAHIKINENKAGPIRIIANVPAEFFVKFKNKEKMVLSLNITEVIKK